jgi:hypothetical protein
MLLKLVWGFSGLFRCPQDFLPGLGGTHGRVKLNTQRRSFLTMNMHHIKFPAVVCVERVCGAGIYGEVAKIRPENNLALNCVTFLISFPKNYCVFWDKFWHKVLPIFRVPHNRVHIRIHTRIFLGSTLKFVAGPMSRNNHGLNKDHNIDIRIHTRIFLGSILLSRNPWVEVLMGWVNIII